MNLRWRIRPKVSLRQHRLQTVVAVGLATNDLPTSCWEIVCSVARFFGCREGSGQSSRIRTGYRMREAPCGSERNQPSHTPLHLPIPDALLRRVCGLIQIVTHSVEKLPELTTILIVKSLQKTLLNLVPGCIDRGGECLSARSQSHRYNAKVSCSVIAFDQPCGR